MKRLEVIHLRLAASLPKEVAQEIRRSVAEAGESWPVRIYRCPALAGDLGIHIHRAAGSPHEGFSDLGVRLAEALREHGMVEHTVWTECTVDDQE